MSEDDVVRAPHVPLTDYYRTEQERPAWLRQMFDSTAPDYNLIEKILGLGTGPWYRRQALLRAGLKSGMNVVDVGAGTGLVAAQAAAIVGSIGAVTGVDPSPGMLRNAQVPASVKLIEGSAESIPFPDNSFDFLSMGYALRHIGDLSRAFVEFRRVLKPGGRLCILEITSPESTVQKAFLKIYLRGVVPALAGSSCATAIRRCCGVIIGIASRPALSPADVLRTLSSAGLTDANHLVILGMFSEYRAFKTAVQ